MARKSRRNLSPALQSEKAVKMYRAGIYARISVEESKNQSSIDTQIFIAQEFIRSNPDIECAKIYIDSGYSSFDKARPDFDKMISEAQSGIINCIIVKDLSRFGRNYIETGNLLESVLPFLEVRFISVSEGYDSNNHDYRDTLAMPLKSIVNYSYSADISRKVKSVFKVKIENGAYISAHAPLGYKKVKTAQGVIYEIDNDNAEIVRTIFELAMSGISIYLVTKKLNAENSGNRIWTQKYVGRILRNNFYTGTYTAGKSESLFTLNAVKKIPQNEWTVIKNHHSAIIDNTTFELIGRMIKKN